jgi:hypothetical protein
LLGAGVTAPAHLAFRVVHSDKATIPIVAWREAFPVVPCLDTSSARPRMEAITAPAVRMATQVEAWPEEELDRPSFLRHHTLSAPRQGRSSVTQTTDRLAHRKS